MRAPWIHRIDAIPKIGTNVKFRPLHEGAVLNGTVVPASGTEQALFAGIGAEVVYQSNGRRFLSNEIEYWKYL
jgi:hypothetical protein